MPDALRRPSGPAQPQKPPKQNARPQPYQSSLSLSIAAEKNPRIRKIPPADHRLRPPAHLAEFPPPTLRVYYMGCASDPRAAMKPQTSSNFTNPSYGLRGHVRPCRARRAGHHHEAHGQVLGGKDRVMQYPEERREDLPISRAAWTCRRYRGVHRLNKDEKAASSASPASCAPPPARPTASTSRRPNPPGRPRKIPRQVRHRRTPLHLLRHVRGGLPGRRHRTDHDYDIVGLTRAEMIFDKAKLLAIYDQTVKEKPM